jgi:hypothetical protein
MPLIVATTFAQQPSATHQGSARTPLGPKVAFEVLLTTDDEVESLPEHGGVDDQGHRH